MNIVFYCIGTEGVLHQSTHLVASAKRVMPNVHITQLSDQTTQQTPGTNTCIRTDLSQYEFLRARIELYHAFAEHLMDQDTVFTDIDMLVNRDLNEMFDGTFDVGLTWRIPPENIPTQHFNAGMILLANTKPAKRFMQLVCEKIRTYPQEHQHWWGDQLALVDVVGEEHFLNRTADIINIDGIRIRFFPCERYNYVPKSGTDDVSDKYLIHYKGPLKQYMASSFKRLFPKEEKDCND